jgi:hypothetical protein
MVEEIAQDITARPNDVIEAFGTMARAYETPTKVPNGPGAGVTRQTRPRNGGQVPLSFSPPTASAAQGGPQPAGQMHELTNLIRANSHRPLPPYIHSNCNQKITLLSSHMSNRVPLFVMPSVSVPALVLSV